MPAVEEDDYDVMYSIDRVHLTFKRQTAQTSSVPYHSLVVSFQEAKYIESWPNTASAWAGWSRFDIPVDRYGGVHSLLQCTEVSYLSLG
jgi:hypothetical protein